MIPLLPMNGAQVVTQSEAQMEVPNRRYSQDGLYSPGSFFCVIWTIVAICVVFGAVLIIGVLTIWQNKVDSSLAFNFTYQPPSHGNFSSSSLENSTFISVISMKQPEEMAYVTTTERISTEQPTTGRFSTERMTAKRSTTEGTSTELTPTVQIPTEPITTMETVPPTTEQPFVLSNPFLFTKKAPNKEAVKNFWQNYFMEQIGKLNPARARTNGTRSM